MRRALSATVVLLGVASAALGETPRWAPGGLPVGTNIADRTGPVICAKPDGGCLVAWLQYFGTYVQSLGGSGVVDSAWTSADGANASPGAPVAPYMQSAPRIASDGLGGAFVLWHDQRDYGCHYNCWDEYKELYATRMTRVDSIASGWTPSGAKVGSAMNYMLDIAGGGPGRLLDFNTVVAPDGNGGMLVAWQERWYPPASGAVAGIHAQRIAADGRLMWGAGGALVCHAAGVQAFPALVATGDGGAVVLWQDSRDDSTVYRIYGQRLGPDGAALWTSNGMAVTHGAVREEQAPAIAGLEGGELTLAWQAGARADSVMVMAERLAPNGQARWPSDVALSGPATKVADLSAAQDAAGDCWFAWTTTDTSGASRIKVQRVNRQGEAACGWSTNGRDASPASASALSRSQVVPSGDEGAFVLWLDGGLPIATRMTACGAIAGGWPAGGLHLSSSTYGSNNLVAVSDGIRGAYVTWEEGAMPSADYEAVLVQRLSRKGIWDGADDLTADPMPDSCRAVAGPVVEGFRPNPSRAAVASVVFSVPVDGPVRIELYDVIGRRVGAQDVGDLSAGRHVIALEPSRRVQPGVYFVRMTQGARSATARGVILP